MSQLSTDKKWQKLCNLTQQINDFEEKEDFPNALQITGKTIGYMEFLIEEGNLHIEDVQYLEKQVKSFNNKADYLKSLLMKVIWFLITMIQ